MIAPQCRASILDYWTIQSHMQGLKIDAESLSIDEQFFLCCSGTGLCFDAQQLKPGGGPSQVVPCDLLRRKYEVLWQIKMTVARLNAESLIGQPPWTLGHLIAQSPDQVFERQKISELRQALGFELDSADLRKGREITWTLPLNRPPSDRRNKGISALSTEAILCGLATSYAWHNKIKLIHLSSEQKSFNKQAICESIQSHRDFKVVFITSWPRQLTDASELSMFEQIVAFAYQLEAPLWILKNSDDNASDSKTSVENGPTATAHKRPDEILPTSKQTYSQSFKKFNLAISEKIAKAPRPVMMLSAQCQSRLRSLCTLSD